MLPAAAAPAAVPTPPAPAQFGFPRFHVDGRAGGSAALKRSRQGLWIGVLLVLAILLGFVFVRFFLGPATEGSNLGSPARSAVHAIASARPAPRLDAGDA
jgi:hypothetical protein